MENEKQAQVSYFVYEGAMARMERIIRILAALLVASLIIFVVDNVIWMKYSERLRAEQTITEVQDGVHQQSDPNTD